MGRGQNCFSEARAAEAWAAKARAAEAGFFLKQIFTTFKFTKAFRSYFEKNFGVKFSKHLRYFETEGHLQGAAKFPREARKPDFPLKPLKKSQSASRIRLILKGLRNTESSPKFPKSGRCFAL